MDVETARTSRRHYKPHSVLYHCQSTFESWSHHQLESSWRQARSNMEATNFLGAKDSHRQQGWIQFTRKSLTTGEPKIGIVSRVRIQITWKHSLPGYQGQSSSAGRNPVHHRSHSPTEEPRTVLSTRKDNKLEPRRTRVWNLPDTWGNREILSEQTWSTEAQDDVRKSVSWSWRCWRTLLIQSAINSKPTWTDVGGQLLKRD